jgi:hypothetical protein
MDEKPVHQEVDNAPSDSTHHTTEAVTGYYFKAPAPEVEIYHDPVARDAIGGQLDTMPPGYYTSVPFIGTVVVSKQFSMRIIHDLGLLAHIRSGMLSRKHQWILELGRSSQYAGAYWHVS